MEETIEKEEFIIDSPERANWLLRKLANLEAEQDRIVVQSNALVRQLESDKNALLHKFQSQLENFTRQELEKSGGKRKSIILLQGTVSFRTVPPRIVIESEADALQTARLVLPSSITTETVERFDKTAFRAYAKERLVAEGELLPGVALTEAREEFGIKFPSAGKVSGEEPGE